MGSSSGTKQDHGLCFLRCARALKIFSLYLIVGMYMGTVIAMPLAGILAQYVNWEAIFYVFGILMFIIKTMLKLFTFRTSGSVLVFIVVVHG